MPDFIVVGGGIAGMVVARRLALAGREVMLVERSTRLGGTVSSHVVGGLTLDAGAESFATRGGIVRSLVGELGLDDDVVEPLPDGAWLQATGDLAFRLPRNSLLGIPGTPLADDVAQAIGAEAATLADRIDRETAVTGLDDSTTLGDLVRSRMGVAVLDGLVRPIVKNVQGVDPDTMTVDAAAPGLRAALVRAGSLAAAVTELRGTSARAGSAVAGIRGGVFRIADALAADLAGLGVDIRLESTVRDVRPHRLDVLGHTVTGRVILAARAVRERRRAPGHEIVLGSLVLTDDRLDGAPRGTGVLVADAARGASGRGVRANALTHATAKWSWLADTARPHQHVLRLSYDPGALSDVRSLPERFLADASELMGIPFDASAVDDTAAVAWYRPERQSHTPDGILAVGESIAGTGLAAVISQAEATARAVTGTTLE